MSKPIMSKESDVGQGLYFELLEDFCTTNSLKKEAQRYKILLQYFSKSQEDTWEKVIFHEIVLGLGFKNTSMYVITLRHTFTLRYIHT